MTHPPAPATDADGGGNGAAGLVPPPPLSAAAPTVVPIPIAAAAAAAPKTPAPQSSSDAPKPSGEKAEAPISASPSPPPTPLDPAAPTGSVETILASLGLPPDTGGSGGSTSSGATATTSTACTWRASDPVRSVLTSSLAPLYSRRPPGSSGGMWSSRFDVAGALAALLRDKAEAPGDAAAAAGRTIVRAAFDAAALAGMRALLVAKAQPHPSGGDEALAQAQAPPPPIVAAMRSIALARDAVLGDVLAAVEGKDSKKGSRGGSGSGIDGGIVLANKRRRSAASSPVPSAAMTPGSSGGKPKKRPKKEGGESGADGSGGGAMEVDGDGETGAAAVAGGAPSPPPAPWAVTSSNVALDASTAAATMSSGKSSAGLTVKRAGYHGKGRAVRPKNIAGPGTVEAGSALLGGGGMGPTTTGGGTGDSSRIVAARAILCAAANLVFQDLTPDCVLVASSEKDAAGSQSSSGDAPTDRPAASSALEGAGTIDELDIPQNKHSAGASGDKDAVNMGAVLMQAKTYSERAVRQTESAVRRADARAKWRASLAAKASVLEKSQLDGRLRRSGSSPTTADTTATSLAASSQPSLLNVGNPFAIGPVAKGSSYDGPNWVTDDDEDATGRAKSSLDPSILAQSKTDHWSKVCLPRLLSVMDKGPGHTVIHDADWQSRPGRIADLLGALDDGHQNRAGPHLIITTEKDLDKFRVVFEKMKHQPSPPKSAPDSVASSPTALIYEGSNMHRRNLRLRHFATLPHVAFTNESMASDVPVPPPAFDVIVTSYLSFFEDYPHFTRIPFHAVVVDDGVSWLSLAANDTSGALSKAYEEGMWSRTDFYAGGAGAGIGAGGVADSGDLSRWDFGSDNGGYVHPSKSSKKVKKDGKEYEPKDHEKAGPSMLLGLTTRHRVLVAPTMSVLGDNIMYTTPVTALVSFLLPQFFDIVGEEWDRAGMVHCASSMGHIKRLLCRSVVVHQSSPSKNEAKDMMTLTMESLSGKLSPSLDQLASIDSTPGPKFEDFCRKSLIASSRKLAFHWLRPGSNIRHELARSRMDRILDYIAARASAGFFCEEITTLSSLTVSGSSGAVVGAAGYRLAARCGRLFASETTLRQHIAQSHAPPGTWICRVCDQDCCASSWRTQHERTCGTTQKVPGSEKNSGGANKRGGASHLGGMAPTVGQNSKKSGTTGGKKNPAPSKDADGSFCVPSWRGIWVNSAGKYFVKIDGKKLTEDDFNADESTTVSTNESSEKSDVKLFDSAEIAAKAHDDAAKRRKLENTELNFKADGTRITYQDNFGAPGDLEILGVDSASIVPALAIINIRDLPPNVKPLLRDPRQTSRTGGQQKRHVYAYRGVCRQVRKGHDRWQAQISFAGTNHYLGTFDSEWDAAAIYAWAHLILYGEEATKQAQKEGEEAAAAYEQEKKDIAAGKIPPPKAKPQTKRKKPGPKKKKKTTKKSDGDSPNLNEFSSDVPPTPVSSFLGDATAGSPLGFDSSTPKQLLSAAPNNVLSELGLDMDEVAEIAENICRREEMVGEDEASMADTVAGRIKALREKRLNETLASANVRRVRGWSACIPVKDGGKIPSGCAMLVGLQSSSFGWAVDSLLDSVKDDFIKPLPPNLADAMNREYGDEGFNNSFRTVLQTSVCTLGRAGQYLEDASVALGLGPLESGATAGHLECNIGGLMQSCSESAARIVYNPTETSDFQFHCVGCETDVVTLNGQRILANAGPYPLRDRDICSVGSRVFLFLCSGK